MWKFRKQKQTAEKQIAPTTWIPSTVIRNTTDILRKSGRNGESHEGVAYWAGRRSGPLCFVTTVIAPAAGTTRGSFDTSIQANAKVVMYLASVGLELIGQVHSHPGSFVGHSKGDDARALMPYEGFLSIIAPNYAKNGMSPLTICGVHVFEKGQFRQMKANEIENNFRITDDIADLRS